MARKPKHDPILDEGRSITIAGAQYDARPLGALDIFRLVPILRHGVAVLQRNGADLQSLTGTDAVLVIVSALETHQKAVIDLAASILSVTPQDFEDTTRFPLDCLVDIIEVVSDDPNLEVFLAKAGKLASKMQAKHRPTTTVSRESFNSSEPPEGTPDGVTASS